MKNVFPYPWSIPWLAITLTIMFAPARATGQSAAIESEKLDLIFVVDTSISMQSENVALAGGMYNGLVGPLEALGKDVQVIVIGQFGTMGAQICFEDPLGAIPFGACGFTPPEPANTGSFKHYSSFVQSLDAWCELLGTFDGSIPDEYMQAPNGWSTWLREDAFKHIFMFSDDRTSCTYDGQVFNDIADPFPTGPENVAGAFDTSLRSLSETQFGTASSRRYMVHAIVGLIENAGRTSDMWFANEPLQFNKCTSGATPGFGHQALSRISGGIRFPICQFITNANVFYDVAATHPRIFTDGLETPAVN